MSRDAHALLLRALGRMAEGAVIASSESVPWASATFTGARHRVTLAFRGAGRRDDADTLARDIAEAAFELRGHLVADAVVAAREEAPHAILLTIEALTVETV